VVKQGIRTARGGRHAARLRNEDCLQAVFPSSVLKGLPEIKKTKPGQSTIAGFYHFTSQLLPGLMTQHN